MNSDLTLALIGSSVTLLATGAGAVPALFFKSVSERAQSALMGFSAGVMLAASAFSLIIPALAIVERESAPVGFGPSLWSASSIGIAVLLGAAFLHLMDRVVPHEHFETGPEGGVSSLPLKRIWLFVFAITLHNFPEGLAVGIGIGSQSLILARPILIGIALQDIPEGFVVAVALLGVGYSKRLAFGVAVLSGVVEAAAAMLGWAATLQVTSLLPWSLAFAGGAMLYVVSNEMIPESHRKAHARVATAGLMVGFVLMMVLDTALS